MMITLTYVLLLKKLVPLRYKPTKTLSKHWLLLSKTLKKSIAYSAASSASNCLLHDRSKTDAQASVFRFRRRQKF